MPQRKRRTKESRVPAYKYRAKNLVNCRDLQDELLELVPDEQWAGGSPIQSVSAIGVWRSNVIPLTEEQAIFCVQLTAQSIKRATGAICNKYVKRAISDCWYYCNGGGGGTPAVWQFNGRPLNGHGTGPGGHSTMLARLADGGWMQFDVAFAKNPDVTTWAVEITEGDRLYIINRL